MKRIVVGVLGLGVAGALAASGAAVAHIVTTGQGLPAHTPSTPADAMAGGAATSDAGTDSASPTASGLLRVYLKGTDGADVAQVDITPVARGGNLVTISAWDLAPGFHAIQLHSAGKCDAPFASAGGLLHTAGMANSATAGAFPVLTVGADGKGRAQFTDANFKLRDLSGTGGSSIVLHGVLPPGLNAAQAATRLADDSRDRVACGVVYRPHPRKVHPTPAPTPTAGSTTPPASPTTPAEPPTTTPTTQAGHHW
jgi:Cu-Zn family superoxide dismutase